MKKIVLCFMLSFALMTFPVMAEENKETASVEETEEAASAAEQNDTVKNLLSKAKALLEEKKYEEAVPFLRKAADQGNAKAMYGLGLLYDLGTGVDKDLEAAAQWYQKALDAGFEPRDEEEAEHLKELIPDRDSASDEESGTADEASATESGAAAEASAEETLELLYELNRASIANMSIGDGPLYVIGHRSPDSDTVCSAIAYARLLKMLGYPAEAAITEPVNKETAFILKAAGVEAPPVLEDASGKSIFLVDHSEYTQAAEGMQDAHIVGILDHHGVGSVATGHQVVYEAKPIGAGCTIVWLDYLNYGLEIDKTTATLLLGAILSDTANLTISSVTETDRQAVSKLAGLAEITDVNEFYRELHSEALSYGDMSNKEIFFSDYKEYEASGVKFGIGLISVIDEEHAKEMAERMKEALPECMKSVDMDLLYAEVGIREGDVKVDYIVSADGQSRDVFEAAFPKCDEFDGTSYIYRNGGLGRKSKLVPGLTEYLNAHPHE